MNHMEFFFPRAALLIIDIQNDFCPGGALAVKGGDEIIEPINRLACLFASSGGRVIATQDWHPENHVSFTSGGGTAGGGLWPSHCVASTAGAQFHPALDLKHVNLILRKGLAKNLDSYSAFFENDRKTPTGLGAYLKTFSIDTVMLAGLAADYCVLYSALDAAAGSYKTIVIRDAIRAVDYPPGSSERALTLLRDAGVTLAETGDFFDIRAGNKPDED